MVLLAFDLDMDGLRTVDFVDGTAPFPMMKPKLDADITFSR